MLSKDETKHIAGLARIGMSENDLDKFAQDLSVILDWVKQLEVLETGTTEPTAHISGIENVTREDAVKEFLAKKKIIKLFPEEKDGYAKVKSIL
jgi:aspartyl-tRNA(Asn)/glutamyl-tRNA(Gln) amidotransferase subunit C